MTRPKKASTSKGKEVAKPNKNRNVADMFSQQRVLRKRTLVPSDDDATDNDDDQLASEDEESDRNAESDASDIPVSSSKRRRTSKRTGLSSQTQSQQRRKRGTNNSANTSVTEVSLTHSSQLLEPVSMEGSESLYDKVANAVENVEEITTSWVDSYRADKEEALRCLINFFIRSCGCMTAVMEDAFTKEDIAVEVLQELQDELAKLPQPEYPIISKSKTGRNLKRNILSFFENLFDQCQHDIIYDGTFTETLQTWLTVMSSSVYRPFRHTATILTFKIMESLCSFADKISSTLTVAQRQLATEEGKSSRARNAEKKRLLRQRVQSAERKKTNLDECITEFFEGVFVHRSRDVENVIRSECIKELCSWMLKYASRFVENQYLRYFGWALNDLNAHVRSEALRAVSRLYRVESIVEKLSDFIERFKARIQEMALYDIDLSVKLHAIDLCNAIFQENHDIFNEESQNVLMNLIFVDNERIQRSIAPFVRNVVETKLLCPMVDEVQDAMRSMSVNDEASRNQNTTVQKSWVSFKCIAGFMVKHFDTDDMAAVQLNSLDSIEDMSAKDTENDSIVAQAVEALWSQLAVLHDYKAMADYLCRDHSTSQAGAPSKVDDYYRLTEQEEAILISVFVTCLKLLTGRGMDKADGRAKKKAQDDLLLKETRANVSSYLVPVISQLLAKHNDSPSKMTKLVVIPQLMNLDAYSELRMNDAYEELLQILTRVYVGATAPALLENCAKSLHQMKTEDLLSGVTDQRIPELVERISGQVQDVCGGKDMTTARLSREEKFSITMNLLRLDNLINFMDITDTLDESENANEDIIDLMGSFVDRASAGTKDEEQMSLSAMAILFRYLSWKCDRIWSDPDLDGPGRAALGRVERRRDWILAKLTGLATLPDMTPTTTVRSTAFGILMDLYWIFSSELFSSKTELGVLQLECPETVQTRCKNYISSELEKWRNLLSEKETEDNNQEDDEDTAKNTESDEQGVQLVANVARAVAAHVLSYEHATSILAQYGHLGAEADEIMKAFIESLKDDILYHEDEASKICQMFLGALKESFETYVNQNPRSIDKTLSLARQMNRVLTLADQEDPARHVSDQVICDRIHIDGVTFALSKAAEEKEQRKSAAVGIPLKFFRVLSTLVKPLSRARDVAKIHKHIDTSLAQYQLSAEQGDKDWEGYSTYVKGIDEILKRKGLRYTHQ